jgi:CheY-like chemotaxis protein
MPSIIIVDDHPVNATMVQTLLEQAGYTDIKTFSDPSEAVRHIKAQEYPPIIITDYNMPGLTGPQLLIHIKETHPDTQGLIMTSAPREASLDEDTKGFPIVDKNHFKFFNEIETLVRDFMSKGEK